MERLPLLAVHDFDEAEVPATADKVWRQQTAEQWVQRGHEYEQKGQDMLLCGQLPHGELLACPSATRPEGIKSCLLDCEDYERIQRIHGRGRGVEAASQDMLNWAAWMRMHSRDPQWRPDVILEGGAPEMRWERWLDWETADPRWRITWLDTSSESLEAPAREY